MHFFSILFFSFILQLVKHYDVESSLLPPKKIFGNLDADHIEKRRVALEQYLQLLIDRFKDNLPDELNYFLEGNKYVSSF